MAQDGREPALVKLPDGRQVRLGMIEPAAKRPALQLAAYFNAAEVTLQPPERVDYASKAIRSLREVYLNDQLGTCVIAGVAHGFGVWSGNDAGSPIMATDAEIRAAYEGICGPGDRGCYIGDVLDYARAVGLTLGSTRRKIDGYVAVESRDVLLLKVATWLFGGLSIGIRTPSEWINAAREGAVWDVPRRIDNRGGHYIRAVDYGPDGMRCSTWGVLVTVTWRALAMSRIVTEVYAELSSHWYGDDRIAPCGIDAKKLLEDLAKIDVGVLPDEPPAPPPPPATKRWRVGWEGGFAEVSSPTTPYVEPVLST